MTGQEIYPLRWFRDLSLARKIVTINLIVTGAVLVGALAGMFTYDMSRARVRLVGRVTLLADVVATQSINAVAPSDAEAARRALTGAALDPHVLSAAVHQADGSVLAQFHRDDAGRDAVPAANPAEAHFDAESLRVTRPIAWPDGRTGTLTVVSDLTELAALQSGYLSIVGLLLAAGLVTTLVVSGGVQSAITAPIRRLTTIMRAASDQHRYDLRADPEGRDDVGELVTRFNEMAAEIQRRDAELLTTREHADVTTDTRVTQLRHANQALADARDRALGASQAKSEFLASMSHEIRTPMNGIIGMTELALDTSLTAQQRDYLDTVKSSADSLLSIVNDILDFSKVESGRLELESIPFSIRDLVSQTMRPHSVAADRKGVELIYGVAEDIPDRLVGDPVRVRQILANLVSNALKFTERGRVSVEVRALVQPDGRASLRLSVADTGIGIDPAKHAAIFDAFSQADGSTTRRFGGTGLGLSIASRLARLMSGRIWLESTPGVGSNFHVDILLGIAKTSAADQPPAAAPAPVVSAVPGGFCVRVLLAEDNVVNQRVAVRMLTKRGHQVVVVDDGRQAIQALERQAFDVVLMDLQMPELGGLEATAAIRDRERTTGQHVHIVAMTAHALKGDRERCLAGGMDGYLSKPIDRLALFHAVEQHASGAAPGQGASAFDYAGLLDRFDGDEQLAGEIVRAFLDDSPRLLALIQSAIAAGNGDQLRAAAHEFKGAVSHFGAAGAVDAARALEILGMHRILDAAPAAWRRLEAEIAHLTAALREIASRQTSVVS